jgi:hypothetical protein
MSSHLMVVGVITIMTSPIMSTTSVTAPQPVLQFTTILERNFDAGCNEDRHLRVIHVTPTGIIRVRFWIDQEPWEALTYECSTTDEVVKAVQSICSRFFAYIRPARIAEWGVEEVEPLWKTSSKSDSPLE